MDIYRQSKERLSEHGQSDWDLDSWCVIADSDAPLIRGRWTEESEYRDHAPWYTDITATGELADELDRLLGEVRDNLSIDRSNFPVRQRDFEDISVTERAVKLVPNEQGRFVGVLRYTIAGGFEHEAAEEQFYEELSQQLDDDQFDGEYLLDENLGDLSAQFDGTVPSRISAEIDARRLTFTAEQVQPQLQRLLEEALLSYAEIIDITGQHWIEDASFAFVETQDQLRERVELSIHVPLHDE